MSEPTLDELTERLAEMKVRLRQQQSRTEASRARLINAQAQVTANEEIEVELTGGLRTVAALMRTAMLAAEEL